MESGTRKPTPQKSEAATAEAPSERDSAESHAPLKSEVMLPNLLIIGAAKAGTSALHAYLSVHPECAMSESQPVHPRRPAWRSHPELNFFLGPGEPGGWDKGVEHYVRSFPRREAKVKGETSPSYTNYPTYVDVPKRAHSVIPDAKLIYLVRDPIERILSHFRMMRARREWAYMSFDSAVVRDMRNPFIRQSKYWFQLSQWLDYYPLERIMILEAEELLDSRQASLERVFRFLGVDADFTHPSFNEVIWTGDENEKAKFGDTPPPKPRPSKKQRWRIREHLADDLSEFRRRTGMKFPKWSV